jgi:hypothetical protein
VPPSAAFAEAPGPRPYLPCLNSLKPDPDMPGLRQKRPSVNSGVRHSYHNNGKLSYPPPRHPPSSGPACDAGPQYPPSAHPSDPYPQHQHRRSESYMRRSDCSGGDSLAAAAAYKGGPSQYVNNRMNVLEVPPTVGYSITPVYLANGVPLASTQILKGQEANQVHRILMELHAKTQVSSQFELWGEKGTSANNTEKSTSPV